MQRRVERLRKQRKVVTGHAASLMDDDNEDSLPADLRETVIEGYLLRKQTAMRSLFEGRDGPCSVEALCLQVCWMGPVLPPPARLHRFSRVTHDGCTCACVRACVRSITTISAAGRAFIAKAASS